MLTGFWCEHADLGTGPVPGVRVVVDGGRIRTVERAATPPATDHRLPGVVLPGFANAHSHAFHRALRGRTHDRAGTFWTWRERMYRVAARLDPDSHLALARAAYAEMALAGVTCVGEFHYLHHPPGGGRYTDPNAMAEGLIQAAADAGMRLTLLDACYLTGGLDGAGHLPLDDVQVRFSDGDAEAWAARTGLLPERDGVRVGVAVHSVRAVPAAQLPTVAHAAGERPLHVHLSEQPAENAACLAHYGTTPTGLLHERGVLGPSTTAVHAIHLTPDDVATLGSTGTGVCACPSTEADLADGIAPLLRLRDAGSPLSLGSDQHVVTDLLAEARLLEDHERLRTGERGRFSPAGLLAALTVDGHRALGWPDAGRIAPDQRADLVAVRLDSPRTAGCAPDQLPMVAAAADVHTVVVDGRVVVTEGRHVLGDVGRLLAAAIDPLWDDA
ncbi:formimidoylglutamate deiminase [Geodermatophilus sabuli]|uniref:Formiminoglutamate deiminase n=1 Tax=Geodermatophilus sabuli TaxID=1564158 RepID=A0A285EKJ5_9ACTN|nr:formimidoylglutamate deiminase [Geodermatophilus sabuli]MBB3084037.1 formiminoglutamate deiminase [Geodermatophilus sabuli]SNX98684.1 formiminoglutamate deiminase [Geodermatophilus sabuli]